MNKQSQNENKSISKNKWKATKLGKWKENEKKKKEKYFHFQSSSIPFLLLESSVQLQRQHNLFPSLGFVSSFLQKLHCRDSYLAGSSVAWERRTRSLSRKRSVIPFFQYYFLRLQFSKSSSFFFTLYLTFFSCFIYLVNDKAL